MSLDEILNLNAPTYKLVILDTVFTIRRMGRDYFIPNMMATVKREDLSEAVKQLSSMGDVTQIIIGDWHYIKQSDNSYKKMFKKEVPKCLRMKI